MRRLWLIVFLSFSCIPAPAAAVRITFEVHCPGLAEGQSVHVTGGHPTLGQWDPRGLRLRPRSDDVWTGSVEVEAGTALEYKVTRGSWETEALTELGRVPPNSRLVASRDETVVIRIDKWKDRDFAPVPLSERITGTVRRHPRMEGRGIGPRDVTVWLPAGYDEEKTRYPVLYMHDGQQVFDPATSTHQVDWGVDETATRLIEEGKLEKLIVVAIDNTGDRAQEYGDTPRGQAYRRFLVEDLKPFIDANYRTLPGRLHTATMGASMGGLVSFLLLWEHPEVFSKAGCLSPAFPPNAIERISRSAAPDPPVSIYLDNGGVGLEAQLQPGIDQVLELLKKKGFEQGKDLLWLKDPEAEHNEAAWAARVWRPLEWFFGNSRTGRTP